jgi:2'-hydroxyisoflavone reductase
MKKILILGGTQFIGRNLVERLLRIQQYDITLFNRQQTHADLFPDVNRIQGDRETDDISQIAGEKWDYVIDLSCYYPDSLNSVLEYLHDSLDKYILISTCSVYDNAHSHSVLRNEEAEILPCDIIQRTDRTSATYGNRKAECERILKQSGQHYIILRPALVYGAYDHTDRFYYWLYLVRQHETLLLPDHGERLFSMTYVQDLIDTILVALTLPIRNRIYNAITVPQASIRQIVDSASALLGTTIETINAEADFLKAHNISQWTDMPLWIDGDSFTYSNQRLKNDLKFEPTGLELSIKDTIEYYDGLGWPELHFGMSETTRQALLQKVKR